MSIALLLMIKDEFNRAANIIKAVEEGNLKKKDEVEIEMKMILKNQNIEHTISDKIKIE